MSDWRGQLVSAVGASAVFSRCVDLLTRTDPERGDLLRVLTYHRVEHANVDPRPYPVVTLEPAVFATQLERLAARHRVISLDEALVAIRSGGGLPPRSVLITFDDAYQDFAEHAWPALKRFGLPVTLFVPTAYPDHPEHRFWWDVLYGAVASTGRPDAVETPVGRLQLDTTAAREKAFVAWREHIKGLPGGEAMTCVERVCEDLEVEPRAPRVLGWEALRSLAGEGVTIGSHTRHHPMMPHVSTEVMRAEVAGSFEDLAREIGDVPRIFAYPGGGFDDRASAVLRDCGVELAFTTRRGINDVRRADPLRLRRINVGRRTTLAVLEAQLLTRAVHLNRS